MDKKSCQPRETLFGIGFERQDVGTMVLDMRNPKKVKNIGMIYPTTFQRGFTLCPLVKRSFQFNRKIPPRFRTSANAEKWVRNYAGTWTKRRYTPLNFLMRYLLTATPIQSTLLQPRILLSIVLLVQAFLTGVLAGFVENIALTIGLLILTVVLGVLSFGAFLRFTKKRAERN